MWIDSLSIMEHNYVSQSCHKENTMKYMPAIFCKATVRYISLFNPQGEF